MITMMTRIAATLVKKNYKLTCCIDGLQEVKMELRLHFYIKSPKLTLYFYL